MICLLPFPNTSSLGGSMFREQGTHASVISSIWFVLAYFTAPKYAQAMDKKYDGTTLFSGRLISGTKSLCVIAFHSNRAPEGSISSQIVIVVKARVLIISEIESVKCAS